MKYHTMLLPERFGRHQNVYGVEVFLYVQRLIVVLHELPCNQGTSITNAADMVATDVLRGLIENGWVSDPEVVTWIEHYPSSFQFDALQPIGACVADTWDLIEFEWDAVARKYRSPNWRPLSGDSDLLPKTAWVKLI
ncbi:hypothetical protein RY831_14640 [Noviherbaspirillum sp. CPCC 100848]|uniref:Uncharacterized protein n=1 Tax=Noviherbaspirillum album TaxID=3080276 RepID=A0ABU6J9R7_9BURK|nr:hypothetical protein [Noviherbaspirillum sp. CPCC 100848]MEC4720397.1 hypothetical protein [Noviherbaspirillum sp. CPCC 100848]